MLYGCTINFGIAIPIALGYRSLNLALMWCITRAVAKTTISLSQLD